MSDMTFVGKDGKWHLEPGAFLVSVGGKQPGFSGAADARTTGLVTGRFVVGDASVEAPAK
jgi:beta-glucosidase